MKAFILFCRMMNYPLKYPDIHLPVSSNSSQFLRLVISRSLGPRAIFRDQEWFELSCLHWYLLDFSVTEAHKFLSHCANLSQDFGLEPSWLLSHMESLCIGGGHWGQRKVWDSAGIYEGRGRSVNICMRLDLINLVSPYQQNTDNTKVLPQVHHEVPPQVSFSQFPGEKKLQVL